MTITIHHRITYGNSGLMILMMVMLIMMMMMVILIMVMVVIMMMMVVIMMIMMVVACLDRWPMDISPTDIWPNGHLAHRHLAERTFGRKDTWQNMHVEKPRLKTLNPQTSPDVTYSLVHHH